MPATTNTKADHATHSGPARPEEVAALLKGAVDLHCHSGPSVMPRVLDHHEALMDAAEAGFAAVVYKDHYYPGMAHAAILEKLFPGTGVRLFSGVALNNAVGGINPYAVEHCVKLGGKIVWLPTFSAANHIEQTAAAKSFPKTAKPMRAPIPLRAVDVNGKLTDDTKACLDLVAEGDIILAGGHLHASELALVYEEAKKRGVRKMMLNHPTYLVDCSDEDIRSFVRLGCYIEHSICMFIDNLRTKQWEPTELKRLIEVAGADRTILGADLGVTEAPHPVEGFRAIVQSLLDLQVPAADIRKMVSTNAASLLGLDLTDKRPQPTG